MNFDLQETTIHGHRVAYRMAGSGPPIMLIHGITASSVVWKTVGLQLARHHTVLAPDLLGHGHSAKPRGDYSMGAFASGIRDLVLTLGLGPVTVVGHSLGGGVAMQFSYQFPDRVERLALVSERRARAAGQRPAPARRPSPARSWCCRCSPAATCSMPAGLWGARSRRPASHLAPT